MGNKLFLSFFIFLVLTSNYVFAQTLESPRIGLEREITNEITQVGNEIEIPAGENATAYLPMYSKTYLRIYQGSKLNFNIVDPDTNAILIKNSMIINDIGPSSTTILLSKNNSDYEEVLFILGKDYKIEYNYSFNPYVIVNQLITHYEEEPSERSIVLYFLVPFLKTSKSNFSQVNPNSINRDVINPTGNAVKNNNNGINPFIIGLILVVVLVVIGLIFKTVKQR